MRRPPLQKHKYITEVLAAEGYQIKKFAGPDITAVSFDDAKSKAKRISPRLVVVGKLIERLKV